MVEGVRECGNATCFFELEAPISIAAQATRHKGVKQFGSLKSVDSKFHQLKRCLSMATPLTSSSWRRPCPGKPWSICAFLRRVNLGLSVPFCAGAAAGRSAERARCQQGRPAVGRRAGRVAAEEAAAGSSHRRGLGARHRPPLAAQLHRWCKSRTRNISSLSHVELRRLVSASARGFEAHSMWKRHSCANLGLTAISMPALWVYACHESRRQTSIALIQVHPVVEHSTIFGGLLTSACQPPAGERIQHQHCGGDGQAAWRERVAAHLRAGAAGGRVHKQYGHTAAQVA